ncbi:glycosyltransferase family 2 protein [Martelella radicis]|uniref:Glycosyltransferase involved in cell wall biosynthesis n=1 Tax=Martelella radicis TaxID=1397476 RepID=A0A7W6KJX8_9HYPH|nr:glycosyltransferase family 2 protein [Martelella radicis]MBB4122699.1 glycosyltransferase involved in cell wall biosynthesis [Martelella radicis]
MKFSIVTNAFNQGAFLRRCIESILGQPFKDIEYIIIDPGSTDETPLILEEYEALSDPRLTIVREKDDGPADGLNKGFERATGDWFFYINADDFLLEDGLELARRAIERHPDADCVYGDGVMTDAHGKVTRRIISSPFSALRYVTGRTEMLQQATFYKAESFRKIGGFNAANKTCWDGEILFDMDRAGMKICKFNGYIGAFVIHPDSISGSKRLLGQFQGDMRRMEQIYFGGPAPQRSEPRRLATKCLDRLCQPRRTIIRMADMLGR